LGISSQAERWHTLDLGGAELCLLDLEHSDIHQRVIAEIDTGVDVYYDERWRATEQFGRLLYSRPDLVEGKSVLILGAGVGLETVVIGKLREKLYVNDLALVSLELCKEQLNQNNIWNYETLPGRLKRLSSQVYI
jgi:predicted nicotinamide N-methyase